MAELPKHTPEEALSELPRIAVQTFKMMDERKEGQGTVNLGPYTYDEAIAASTALAAKANEIARTQSLIIPTACEVGVTADPESGQFLSVVRYTRLQNTPVDRDSESPPPDQVVSDFPGHARGAMKPWRESGRNTTEITLGPFDHTVAGEIAAGILPNALHLASTESPYPQPECIVKVTPGDIAWEVVISFKTFDLTDA